MKPGSLFAGCFAELFHFALQVEVTEHHLRFEVEISRFELLLKLPHGRDVGVRPQPTQ